MSQGRPPPGQYHHLSVRPSVCKQYPISHYSIWTRCHRADPHQDSITICLSVRPSVSNIRFPITVHERDVAGPTTTRTVSPSVRLSVCLSVSNILFPITVHERDVAGQTPTRTVSPSVCPSVCLSVNNILFPITVYECHVAGQTPTRTVSPLGPHHDIL